MSTSTTRHNPAAFRRSYYNQPTQVVQRRASESPTLLQKAATATNKNDTITSATTTTTSGSGSGRHHHSVSKGRTAAIVESSTHHHPSSRGGGSAVSALQFVPAVHNSISDSSAHRFPANSNTNTTKTPSEASWDAILEEEMKEQHQPRQPQVGGGGECWGGGGGSSAARQQKQMHFGSNSSIDPSKPSCLNKLSKSVVMGHQPRNNNSSSSKAHSGTGSATSNGSNSLSRIKQLWRGRQSATMTASPATTATTATTHPTSPAYSSSSSGAFVGWPGTQDRSGKTIPIPRTSYDDENENDDDELGKAHLEISRWTAQTTSLSMDDDEEEQHQHSLDSLSSPNIRGEKDRSSSSTSQFGREEEAVPSPPDPTSYAEFHLAAAVADAQAAAAARRRSSSSRSALQYQREAAEAHYENKDMMSNHQAGDQKEEENLDGTAVRPSKHSAAKKNGSNWQPPARSSRQHATAAVQNRATAAAPEYEPQQVEPPTPPDDFSPDAEAVRFGKAWEERSQHSNQSGSIAAGGGGSGGSSSSSPLERRRLVYSSSKQQQEHEQQAQQRDATTNPQPPTKEALQFNDQLSPPHRNYHYSNAKGYRGLIDKTKEVPCLMDGDSDSLSSSKASGQSNHHRNSNNSNKWHSPPANHRTVSDLETVSDVFDGLTISNDSDVFDGVSLGEHSGRQFNRATPPSARHHNHHHRISYPASIAEEENGDTEKKTNEPEAFQVVMLGGGLTTIQTTQTDFFNRKTASDFDGNLTNSDCSSNGFTRIPGFHEMVSAGQDRDSSLRGIHGNIGARPRVGTAASTAMSSSTVSKDYMTEHQRHGGRDSAPSSDTSTSSDASSLFTDPYRSFYEVDGDLSEYYIQPSVMKKVVKRYRNLSERFAYNMNFTEFEREEDERKAFALFEMRSRVMEKDIERGLERRGGSVTVDDLVTTPYNRTAHRIRDAVIVSKAWRDGATIADVVNTALLTRREEHSYFIKRPTSTGRRLSSTKSPTYTWEAVNWIDDTSFTQFRCPSLGSRHLHGFEMFTIGDCQSMLLKLTNERCNELRQELNKATARQIAAEELMKEEQDTYDGMMTEAEMSYLASMEEVKTISKKLVGAERAFSLVRDRIEKLMSRYEMLLAKIETESFAGASSVVTNDSSYYSEANRSELIREERAWARRAERAEVRAEIAAREALMAKNEARAVREEKIREVEALHQRLVELQSESTAALSEREQAMVTKSLSAARTSPTQGQGSTFSASRLSQGNLDGVKQRFRNRMASRKVVLVTPSPPNRAPVHPSPYHHQRRSPKGRSPPVEADREILRSAGEEMYQQMDFYERSLKAVDYNRGF